MDKDVKKDIDEYLKSTEFKKKVNDIISDVLETFVDSVYSRKAQIKNMARKY